MPSIAKSGPYSWVDLDKQGIKGRKGSSSLSRHLDQKKKLGDFVRLSFTRKHPMMFVAKREGRLIDPVVSAPGRGVTLWCVVQRP